MTTLLSRDRLLDVIDLLPDALFVVDAQGHYLFVNGACEQLLGYRPAELIGRRMMDLVLPEDRAKTARAAQVVMAGHPLNCFENRYVRKDGRVVDVMWSARWSGDGGFRLAIARDMTEHRRAARLQQVLYRICEAAQSDLDVTDFFGSIHACVADLLPLHGFCVALYDAREDTLSYPYFHSPSGRVPPSGPLAEVMPGADVIRAGRTLLQRPRGEGSDTGGSDRLGAPLMDKGRIIGAVILETGAGGARYCERDKATLELVAVQIASAIKRRRNEERLVHMARHDALTDLANRTVFRDALDLALRRAKRYEECVGLLFVDINGFKRINDTFGHEHGDHLLQMIAVRLRKSVRESDLVGRFGGDEFTLLMTNIREAQSVGLVAAKVRHAIGAAFELHGRKVRVSASVGTAVYPWDGLTQDELFRKADITMYEAKRASR